MTYHSLEVSINFAITISKVFECEKEKYFPEQNYTHYLLVPLLNGGICPHQVT